MNSPHDEPEHRSAGEKQAEPAAHGAAGNSRPARTRPRPADPAWPERVRATWESCLQAHRLAADLLKEARKYSPDAWPGGDPAGTAWEKAYDANLAAEAAYEEYSEAWDDWQFGPRVSADHDDPEAGS